MPRRRARARRPATLLAALALVLTLPSLAGSGQAGQADTSQSDIIGGTDVSWAPWAAAVFRDGAFHCSGTIVAPRWVLTASHCAGGSMVVRVGSAMLDWGGEVATVTDVSSSPSGDLTLLRLDRPVDAAFSPLATRLPRIGSRNTIYGWGKTSLNGTPSLQLKRAIVRVTSTTCHDLLGGRGICSEGIDGVAWGGDSGGPQFADGVQVGVASTSDGTETQTFAAVASSRAWIRAVAGV